MSAFLFMSLAALCASGIAGAGAAGSIPAPVETESRVTRVGLFKNGLAEVTRRAVLPGAGRYELGEVPDPVHGTFWIQSDAELETRLRPRLVESPVGLPATGEPGSELATAGGRSVAAYPEPEPEAQAQPAVRPMPEEPAPAPRQARVPASPPEAEPRAPRPRDC